jgi:hemoglobin
MLGRPARRPALAGRVFVSIAGQAFTIGGIWLPTDAPAPNDGRMGTLYDEVGGIEGLRTLSTDFYQRVLTDEVLAPMFAHFTPTHVDHVAVWLAEVFGGPAEFTGRLGGHQALLRVHLGLDIHDEHRERWLALMSDAIESVLPGRPDLATPMMDYFRWGTAIAQDLSHTPAGTDLGEPGPTPRWGHNGLIE